MEAKLADEKGPPVVAFCALVEHSGDYGPFKKDTNVVYNSVITNVGSAYHECAGVFVAPVAGVYYFSFFYHAGGHRVAKLILYKNHERVAMTSDHKSSDTADNGGNAAVLQLEKWDHIYVCMPAGCHVWAAESHTTFNGFLVKCKE